jgi:hypothetical protein
MGVFDYDSSPVWKFMQKESLGLPQVSVIKKSIVLQLAFLLQV